jgi:ketosteroid isomerase-like protein
MSENTEFVHRWWEGFNSDGLPPLDLCHERVEIRIQSEFPFTGVYVGEEGVRKWASEVFDVFESHRLEIEEIVEADSETVVMAVRSVGRTKHEDFEVDFPWAALWVIRENQLVYAQGYLTMAEARKAAGLSQ